MPERAAAGGCFPDGGGDYADRVSTPHDLLAVFVFQRAGHFVAELAVVAVDGSA